MSKDEDYEVEDQREEILIGVVDQSAAGERLDKVLPQLFPPYSRSQLQAWLKDGRIRLGDDVPPARLSVAGGEAISLTIPPMPPAKWVAEDLPLPVVFEDQDIVVIDKPAGWVVHPGAGNSSGTLANAILHRYPSASALPRAGIVHRLDKETSGLLVVALSERARGRLIADLENRDVHRKYLAVVNGTPISGGTVDAPIGRHPRDRIKMAVTENGKPAETEYRIIERFRGHTLLSLRLKSGRTHQIRVHMAHLGFPLVGDPLYGDRVRLPAQAGEELINTLRQFRRQALHATMLGFLHPATDEELSWSSPPPADFLKLVESLRLDANSAHD